MTRRSAAAFLADVEELQAFAVTGLGGSVDASAAARTACGVTLSGGTASCTSPPLPLPQPPAAAAPGPARKLCTCRGEFCALFCLHMYIPFIVAC